MKKYAPRKVFILENGEYIEISYEELCRREENDPSYKDKFFIPLHGMIMEVDETAYRDFYKAKDRDEYLTWRTKYKDISYNQFDDDECCGEDMLADDSEDIAEALAWQQILDNPSSFARSRSGTHPLSDNIVPFVTNLEPFHRFLSDEEESVLKYVLLATNGNGSSTDQFLRDVPEE